MYMSMKELQLTVKQIKYMEIMNELVQVEQKLSESPPEATLLKVMRRKVLAYTFIYLFAKIYVHFVDVINA